MSKEKEIKAVFHKEISPLLTGLRNEIKNTNESTQKTFDSITAILSEIKDARTPMTGADFLQLIKGEKGDKGDFVKGDKGDRGDKGDSIKGDKGEPGIAGYSPIFGKDFWTAKEQDEFASAILAQAKPVKGVHYFDGEKGEQGAPGRDGTEISADDIRNKLESLKGKFRLKIKAIDGLEEALASKNSGGAGLGGTGGNSGGTATVDLSAYSTKVQADALYKPIGYTPDLSAYSTKSVADTLYNSKIIPIFWYKCNDATNNNFVTSDTLPYPGDFDHLYDARLYRFDPDDEYGVAVNTSTVTMAGSKAKAFLFDGATQHYIDTRKSFESTFKNSFSIALSVKPTDGRVAETLFGATADSRNNVTLVKNADGTLTFRYTSKGGIRPTIQGSVTITTPVVFSEGQNEWHHIICTMYNDNSFGDVFDADEWCGIYFDGQFIGSYPDDRRMGVDMDQAYMNDYESSSNLFFGASGNESGYAEGFYTGGIADIRIVEHMVSQAEATEIYKDSILTGGVYGTITTASLVGKTVTIKNGLITSIA